MKLLVDANLSPRVAARLRDAGYDALHVADHDLLRASDETILAHARALGHVIVSADTDFGTLLASAAGRARRSSCCAQPTTLVRMGRLRC